MRAAALLILALWAAPGLLSAAESRLQQQQAEARRDREALRERIGRLEKQIESGEASRRDVTFALKESEEAISELDRKLEDLAADTVRSGEELKDVQRRIGEKSAELSKRQEYLAAQLRAQYAGGLSPWAALLSGDDPQDIARELGYLEYVARAQAEALRAVRATLDELNDLETQARNHETKLQQLAKETTQRREELQARREERVAVLARIEQELKQQRNEAQTLTRNEARLGKLVDQLAVAIEEEAEAARKRAEEARRLAEERRREQERKEAEERRRAEEERRKAEEVRLAEAQRKQAAAQAAGRAQAEAEARAKAEEARKVAEARQAAEAIRAQQAESAQAQTPTRITGRVAGENPTPALRERPVEASSPSAAETPPPSVASLTPSPSPSPTPSGLRKGLSFPVRGEVQGRFGMERPEGGTWRGIVLRASEGTRVAAVAPGRVVYAGWLAGFGNLMIVDHGEKFLTVYAYNQGLLKQVGDQVRAGDAIATVGATGGQVEPGLYFEIRHEGKPVNPLLWLGKQ